LKCQRFTPLGCKDIAIVRSEFVAKTQFAFYLCEKFVWMVPFFLEFSQIILNFECVVNMWRNEYLCSAIQIPQPATYICKCIANNVQYNVKEYNSSYIVSNFFLFYAIIVQSLHFLNKSATLNCSVGWMEISAVADAFLYFGSAGCSAEQESV